MQIWRGWPPREQKLHGAFVGGVITVGNFDGWHLGHQQLLLRARSLGRPLVVMTFDPHPVQVLRPQVAFGRLFPREDLAEQLAKMNTDLLVILSFNQELAQLSAEDFWQQHLLSPLQPQNIVIGHDFAFGRNRQGTATELKRWAASAKVGLHEVPAFSLDGELVSSRRIRELVLAGDVSRARKLLGRSFYLRGPVVFGEGRGQALGVRTLNQQVVNEILPARGVYASRVLCGGEIWPSVTNIGVNPTFHPEATAVKVETHVLDRELNLRGASVDVELIERLRPEMQFASPQDLKKQIERDILEAKVVIANYESVDSTQHRK